MLDVRDVITHDRLKVTTASNQNSIISETAKIGINIKKFLNWQAGIVKKEQWVGLKYFGYDSINIDQ